MQLSIVGSFNFSRRNSTLVHWEAIFLWLLSESNTLKCSVSVYLYVCPTLLSFFFLFCTRIFTFFCFLRSPRRHIHRHISFLRSIKIYWLQSRDPRCRKATASMLVVFSFFEMWFDSSLEMTRIQRKKVRRNEQEKFRTCESTSYCIKKFKKSKSWTVYGSQLVIQKMHYNYMYFFLYQIRRTRFRSSMIVRVYFCSFDIHHHLSKFLSRDILQLFITLSIDVHLLRV